MTTNTNAKTKTKFGRAGGKIILAGGIIILAGGEIILTGNTKKNQMRNLIHRFTNTKPQIWK